MTHTTPRTNQEILDATHKIRLAYRLKRTLRYSTVRDFNAHNESVAEHVFALFFLAEYFLPFEDPEKKLDVRKLYQILLFHDFGEIAHGDVPYHIKTEAHEAQEEADAEAIFGELPPSLGTIGNASWRAYKNQDSPEARFACALDKIEPLFELLDPINEQSMKRLKFTYEDHRKRKWESTENFPLMRRFVEAISDDMLARDVFWRDESTTDSK